MNEPVTVAVLGATGYIGNRLVPRLAAAGYRVRAIARNPAKLHGRPWAGSPLVELAAADVFDRASLTEALRGCQAVYYLVHSMNAPGADFATADRTAAGNCAAAAAAAGVARIIYLGGLGEAGPGLSKHLASRAEVGRILAAGSVPVTTLRAAMVIGSGSASFEILRYLVERLPLMVTPRWIDTPCQPIGVRDVLGYLVGCLTCPATNGGTFDIGSAEVVSYRQLMQIYAEEAGLRRRWIVPVPVLTPRLSSYWIHLVTPVPAALARPLAEGLSNPVLCHDQRIRALVPLPLLSCREAIRRALEVQQRQQVESSWSDAGPIPPAEWALPGDPAWSGGTLREDARRIVLAARPDQVWPALLQLGGDRGWHGGDWLWRLRGLTDRLLGGVGLVRGRRSPGELRPGDALDFWRVVAVEPPRRLLLVAEMKLPGQGTLELSLHEPTPGQTELRQVARFLPRGLGGLFYWAAVAPFHALAFNALLLGLARDAGAPIVSGPERFAAARHAPPLSE